jgi:hypothetical protein
VGAELTELLTYIYEKAPALLGWSVAAIMFWRVYADTAKSRITAKDVFDDLHDLVAAYHAAIVENTRVTERLATLIEERTRARPPR